MSHRAMGGLRPHGGVAAATCGEACCVPFAGAGATSAAAVATTVAATAGNVGSSVS